MSARREPSTLAAAAVAVSALYLATASPHILGGDNGEFATLFAERGVAHPSGYPLYTLVLHALSWLPCHTPAEGAARVTALLGGLSFVAWNRAARYWGASSEAALLAAGAYAVSSLPWRLATHAEVFTLNALLAGAIVAAAGEASPWRGARRAVILGALAGFALANHLSCVLLAPLGLEALARARAEDQGRARSFALAPLAALPGLSTYLLLPVWARDPGDRLVWGDPTTLRAVAHHVLRGDYGIASLSPSSAPIDAAGQLAWFARSLSDNTALVGIAAALVGAWALRREGIRRSWLAFAATLLLAGPAFLSRFNIAPTGVGRAVVERFHLLPLALLVPLIARGVDAAARVLPLRPVARAGASLALLLALIARASPALHDAHGPEVEQYLRETLEGVAPRAVILCTGDHRTLGYPYLQRAQGLRRDVLVIDPWTLLVPGMPARLSARLGAPIPTPAGRSVNTAALAAAALSTGRPLYLSDPFSRTILRTFPNYPEGAMIRVLPVDARPPPLGVIVADTLARADRTRVVPVTTPPGPWQRLAREDLARPWMSLAEVLTRAGRPELGESLRLRAARTAPWIAQTSGAPGS